MYEVVLSCNLEILYEYSDMLNTNECNIFKSLRMCKTLSLMRSCSTITTFCC